MARAICEGAPKTARDDGRAYLIAEGSEAVAFNPTGTDAEGNQIGQLAVTGTVRGGAVSADRLVHIPGKGDFQVERVRQHASADEPREDMRRATLVVPSHKHKLNV